MWKKVVGGVAAFAVIGVLGYGYSKIKDEEALVRQNLMAVDQSSYKLNDKVGYSSECGADGWVTARSMSGSFFAEAKERYFNDKDVAFIRVELGAKSRQYLVFDNVNTDYLAFSSFKKENDFWSSRFEDLIVDIGHKGMMVLRVAPPELLTQYPGVYPMEIVTLKKKSGASRVFVTRKGDKVILRHEDDNMDASGMKCEQGLGCQFVDGALQIQKRDLKKIRAKWPGDEMMARMRKACAYVANDAYIKAKISRFKSHDGACVGAVRPDEILNAYDKRVEDCRVVNDELLDMAKEFLGEQKKKVIIKKPVDKSLL